MQLLNGWTERIDQIEPANELDQVNTILPKSVSFFRGRLNHVQTASEAKMMAEFIDDPYIQDLLFEKAVTKYWAPGPSYISECTAVFMKAGTNVLPRLRETLRSGGNWMIRNRMAQTLWTYGRELDPAGCTEALLHSLKFDPSEDVRGPLFRIMLGKWAKSPVSAELEKEIGKILYTEENTLMKYLGAWYRYSGDEHLPFFQDLLKNGKGWENRWFALRRIWSIRARGSDVKWEKKMPNGRTQTTSVNMDKDVLPDLINALHNDPSWRIRFAAIDGIYEFSGPKVVNALCRTMLADKDNEIRSYTARMLGFRKDPAAVPSLVKALKDKDPFVRYYAAIALGNIRDKRGVQALRDFGSDEEHWVEKAVRQSLSRATH